MRRMTLLTVCLSLPFLAQGQIQQLLATAGQSRSGAGITVEWSLGETAIGPFGQADMVTQGFHQGEVEIPTAAAPIPSLPAFLIRKTPGLVLLRFQDAGITHQVKLFGSDGRLIESHLALPGLKELALPIGRMATGLLYLNIYSEGKGLVHSETVIGGSF